MSSQPTCSCSSFERLEGASVPAYIKAFLEQSDETKAADETEAANKTEAGNKARFRCRVCGRTWERHAPRHEGGRPSLIRTD